MPLKRSGLEFLAVVWALALAASLPAREVTDAAGRRVEVPDLVERSFGTAPPPSLLIEVVAPGKLVAVNAPASSAYYAKNTRWLSSRFVSLPAVGGWHGSAKGANMESLLKLDPQLVIGWRNDYVMEPVLKAFTAFKIPVVFVDEDHVADEPGALRLVGLALGRAEEGERLARDAERRLEGVRKQVAALPESRRLAIYYAEGPDGLGTEFETSFHFDPFRFAGAKSVFAGAQSSMVGMERVSIEEVLKKNPAVIICDNPEFFARVKTDPRWADVPAVRAGRVFLIPKDPLSFIDRPPCFMRILGVQWLASVLYPDLYDADIVAETVSFYRDYLHCAIGEAEARRILGK